MVRLFLHSLNWMMLSRIRRAGADFAFAPDGLPAHSGPGGGPEVGDEFGQIALVFRNSDEAADGVRLAGAAAAADAGQLLDVAAGHAYLPRTFAESAEVEGERTFATQFAQGAEAI